MADRYIYLPIIGIFFFFMIIIKKYSSNKIFSSIIIFISSGLILYYSYTTNKFIKYWYNEETLFAHTIKVSPNAIPVKNFLGILYKSTGDYNKAINVFSDIIDEYPSYSSAYNNRGNIYRAQKKPDLALQDYNQALKNEKKDKDKSSIYTNMGIIYAMNQDYTNVLNNFDEALKLNKSNYLAYFNRGKTFAVMGDLNLALNDLNYTIEVNPDFGMVYYTRGMVKYNLKMYEESELDLNRAKEKGVTLKQKN